MRQHDTTRTVTADGVVFRDLNGNGVLDPYEDARLPVADRVEDLLGRLSLEEKAGLMVHTVSTISADGTLDGPGMSPQRPTPRDSVGQRLVTHLNVQILPEPRLMAHWTNEVQALAAHTGHGIPVTFSTDPRHSFTENWGASFSADHLSAWPEPLGLGALGDPDAVREFADIARREYRALGIRSALHPTLDLATEPRWARQYSTFGDDAALTSELGAAYLDGYEGAAALTADGVACMAKHFPGGGPQQDGEDPHFPYGKHQVYPAGAFDAHLEPFRRAIAHGVSAIMPSYGIPIGLVIDGEPIEEVAFGFNRQIITGLLRERLGYDGVVCTDWSLVTESRRGEQHLPARAWGVEHLDELGRVERILDAGCNQLGGEDDPSCIVELVRSGRVPETRLDESARRLLTVKFRLGLFEDPYVDEDTAAASVGTGGFTAAGRRAQARSATLLTNRDDASGRPTLPLAPGTRVHSAEVAGAALERAGYVSVGRPEEADVVIVRTATPFDPRNEYMLEDSFNAGGLAFDEAFVARLRDLAASTPVVLVVHLDRPALLAPVVDHAAAVLAVYGASDDAVLDVLTGAEPAAGSLPFEIPRSQDAIEAAPSDAPGGTVDPVFRRGHSVARHTARR